MYVVHPSHQKTRILKGYPLFHPNEKDIHFYTHFYTKLNQPKTTPKTTPPVHPSHKKTRKAIIKRILLKGHPLL